MLSGEKTEENKKKNSDRPKKEKKGKDTKGKDKHTERNRITTLTPHPPSVRPPHARSLGRSLSEQKT